MPERGCHSAPQTGPQAGPRTGSRRGTTATEAKGVVVALAGNPNVGKSSLFNHLTGSHQHVGNWPGKTVERRAGDCRRGSRPMTIVDLPGAYSLASSSPEEVVAEEFLTGDGVDVVAVVLDSTNLERNLYLAAQIAELGRDLVVVLNMSDVAEADGIHIDGGALADALGASVVHTAGRTGTGIGELVAALEAAVAHHDRPPRSERLAGGAAVTGLHIDYGEPVEREVRALTGLVESLGGAPAGSTRWTALKLLEGDAPTAAALHALGEPGRVVVGEARQAAERVRQATGEDVPMLVADRRFAWANRLAGSIVERETTLRSRTERIDDVLTSRWFGIPIFLGLMWAVFTLVTDVAGPFVDWVDGLVTGPVAALATSVLSAVGLEGTWVEALVVDGILGGVGSVVVFVPILVVLYLALGVLEDSGYMARAAFLLDRLMRPIGLTGKSFLPLLLGFGCNVPGVYATRVLDRRRDRVVTSLLVPFVSCAARLPVYVLLAAIFFPGARGTVVFVMYVASILAVLLVGGLLDRFVMRGERTDSFILELPSYRKPSWPILLRYVSVRVRSFLARAGTVIFACSLVVWFLLAVPISGNGSFAETEMDDSAFAGAAQVVAPVLAPAGLDSWQVAGTLASGFVAKEVVVATMEQAYGGESEEDASETDPIAALGESARGLLTAVRDAALAVPKIVGIDLGGGGEAAEPDIAAAVRSDFDDSSGGHGDLAAAAFLAIVLLYVPCMATVAAIRHEIGSRWAFASIALNLAVAWLAGVAIFQGGLLLGIG